MFNLLEFLQEMELGGKSASLEEIEILRNGLPNLEFPQWLVQVYRQLRICGCCFSLAEEFDRSELGAELSWMTPREAMQEAIDAYPGIAAIKNNLLPFGNCEKGMGDPYFLDLIKPCDPAVVRVPHNAVSSDDALVIESVELVSESLSVFLRSAILID